MQCRATKCNGGIDRKYSLGELRHNLAVQPSAQYCASGCIAPFETLNADFDFHD
jgi:hypothetical protein